MFDLNIVLDVVQRREPHYRLSAAALSAAIRGDVQGIFPCHGIATVHYLVSRYADKAKADELVDWLCGRLRIGTARREEFQRARALPFTDFEDAVVCAVAEANACDVIVTRNLGDFSRSPVRTLSAEEFLVRLQEKGS